MDDKMRRAVEIVQSALELIIEQNPRLAPRCRECEARHVELEEMALIFEQGMCSICIEKAKKIEIEYVRLDDDEGREWS